MLKSFTKSVSKYAQFMPIIGLVYAKKNFNSKKLIPNISPGRIGIHKQIYRGTYSGAYIWRKFCNSICV